MAAQVSISNTGRYHPSRSWLGNQGADVRVASGQRAAARSRHLRSARLAAAAVALLVLVAGCTTGGGDSRAAGAGNTAATSGPQQTTTTVAPSPRQTATTVARDEPSSPIAAVPYVMKLLGRYDKLVEKIVADPSVARDRGDPLVREFLGLFPRGNEFADGSLKGWVAQADKAVTIKPVAAGRPVSVTKLHGSTFQVTARNTISYDQCTILNYVLYTKGALTERAEGRRLAGTVTVVRVRGHWRISAISTPPGLKTGCSEEGGVRS